MSPTCFWLCWVGLDGLLILVSGHPLRLRASTLHCPPQCGCPRPFFGCLGGSRVRLYTTGNSACRQRRTVGEQMRVPDHIWREFPGHPPRGGIVTPEDAYGIGSQASDSPLAHSPNAARMHRPWPQDPDTTTRFSAPVTQLVHRAASNHSPSSRPPSRLGISCRATTDSMPSGESSPPPQHRHRSNNPHHPIHCIAAVCDLLLVSFRVSVRIPAKYAWFCTF